MINPEKEIIIDLSTSCTKNQAVAKLLGWSQGDFFYKYIKVTEKGVSPDQLPFMHPQAIDLVEQLEEMHENARQELLKAYPEEAFHASFDLEKHLSSTELLEELSKKADKVDEIRDLIKKARNYAMDIDDELSKGHESMIRIDQELSKSSGVCHITLRSLDRWKDSFYGKLNEEKKTSTPPIEIKQVNSHQYEGDIDENKLSKGDKSAYITLALAIEAITRKSENKFRKPNKESNASEIAKHLADLAREGLNGKDFPGQGEQAIRKRIDLALKLNSKALKEL